MKLLAFSISTFLISPLVSANDEYVAVDPSQLESVDGDTLLIIAYAVVIGMLSLYWVWMMYRSRTLTVKSRLLERSEK